MAAVLCTVNVGRGGDPEKFAGKTVNVYSAWANAYAQDSTNLTTIYDITITASTPAIAAGSAISQAAKTTGVTVRADGTIWFYVEASTVMYLAMDDPNFQNGFKVAAEAT